MIVWLRVENEREERQLQASVRGRRGAGGEGGRAKGREGGKERESVTGG